MESLFKRLFRYRPTAGRQPWEDWFTESFAAVLDRYPRLGAAYADRLIGRAVETADIETQRTFNAARPDMWIDARDDDGRRHVVMVEHKMGAPAGRCQLEAYERCLHRLTAETKTLVHIARSTEAPDFEVTSASVRFECLRWFEVYRWLQRWAANTRSGGEAVELVDELLKFMKERGMSIEIGMDELAAYTVCKASGVEQQLEQLLDAVWDDCGMTAAIGETEGKWRRPNKESIDWVSPKIVRHGVNVIYGFDFSREDPEWDTGRLRLPSAYVGIWSSEPDGTCTLRCPAGWKERPTWPESYAWGCQISELRLRGESLSASYLEFFTGAFTALKVVLGDGLGGDLAVDDVDADARR